jgi:hypothetical protein
MERRCLKPGSPPKRNRRNRRNGSPDETKVAGDYLELGAPRGNWHVGYAFPVFRFAPYGLVWLSPTLWRARISG